MHHARRLTRSALAALALLLTPSILPSAALADGAAAKAAADGLSAQQIIDKMLDANGSLGVSSGRAQLTMNIVARDGSTRPRALDVRSKKVSGAARSIVKLTAPKDVSGQAFLFVENKKSEDDVWMYLPAFKVTRRIEGSQKNGSFLGSHFTFADMESRDVQDAHLKRLPDAKVGPHDAYVIESTPKKPADSEYGKVITFVRKSDFMPLKSRFFAKNGEDVVKTLFVEQIDKTKKGTPYVKQMTLRPKAGGYTTIAIVSVDDATDLPDAVFTREQLGK